MIDERQPEPTRQLMLLLGLALVLAVLAFVACFAVWQVTLGVLWFAWIPEPATARLVYIVSQVIFAFGVVLVLLMGEPWLRRRMAIGKLWSSFAAAAAGLIAFGLIGLLIGVLVRP